ncbi:MAG: cysteine desulfurase family protein [Candidatus Puniceispirillales bacterium]
MLETYLDYNATAPLRPEARDAMIAVLDAPANPSSVHGFGQQARLKVEDARARVAGLARAMPEELIFTSGGTEANAMALMRDWPQVFVGATEHAAVLEAAPGAVQLKVDPEGRVDLISLEAALADAPEGSLVSVMAANNETGVIQPLAEIIAVARRHGAFVHSDAVQGFGKIPLDFARLGLDLMSLSAHKIGGPTGIGVLIQREGIAANPLSRGGGQERNRRPGTENVAGIVGFGAAADAADPAGFAAHCQPLRDHLEARIKAGLSDAVIIAEAAPRLANTTCLALPGRGAETQVMALDLAGIAVSAGAACSSGKVRTSHVLEAMGAADLAGCAIRISSGWATTADDIERLAEALINLYKHS